jgi:hypothetical protein
MKEGTSSTQVLEEDIGSLVGTDKESEPARDPDPQTEESASGDEK